MKSTKLEGLLVYVNHRSKIALIKTEEGNFFCDFNSNPKLASLGVFPDLKVTLDVARTTATFKQTTKTKNFKNNSLRNLKLVEVA